MGSGKYNWLFFLVFQTAVSAVAQSDIYTGLEALQFTGESYRHVEDYKHSLDLLDTLAVTDSATIYEQKYVVANMLKFFGATQQGVRFTASFRAEVLAIDSIGLYSGYLRNLGSQYLANQEYAQAIQQYKASLQLNLKLRKDPKADTLKSYAFTLNDLGIALYESDSLHRALRVLKDARRLFKRLEPDGDRFLASINDNIGITYIKLGQLDSARATFNRNAQLLSDTFHSRSVQLEIRFATLAIMEGRYQEAETRLATALTHMTNLGNVRRLYIQELMLQQLLLLAERTNNMRLKAATLAKYMEFEQVTGEMRNEIIDVTFKKLDHIMDERWKAVVANKDMELRESTYKIQTYKEKQELSNQRLLFLIISSVMVLVLVVFYFATRSRKLKEKMTIERLHQEVVESKLENEQLRSKRLAEDLEIKKKDLTNASLEISRKQKWLEDLQQRLLSEKADKAMDARIKMVVNDLKAQMLTEEKQQKFFDQIEQVNQSFYLALRKQYPQITPKEIELCGLLRLNLSNKEIAMYRNIMPESVKTARKRLRKKLGLKPGQNLFTFLQEIS